MQHRLRATGETRINLSYQLIRPNTIPYRAFSFKSPRRVAAGMAATRGVRHDQNYSLKEEKSKEPVNLPPLLRRFLLFAPGETKTPVEM